MNYDQISSYFDDTALIWARQFDKKQSIMHPVIKIPGQNTSRLRSSRYLEEVMLSAADAMDAKKVFDLGCGFGASMLYSSNIRPETVFSGICASDIELEITRNLIRDTGKVQSILVFRGDFEDARNYRVFPAQDIIYSFDSFRHVRDSAVLFSLVHHLLRQSGRLIIADWFGIGDRGHETSRSSKLLESWRVNAGLSSIPALTDILGLAEQAGFKLLDNQSCGSWIAISGLKRILWALSAPLQAIYGQGSTMVRNALRSADASCKQGILDYRILIWERS